MSLFYLLIRLIFQLGMELVEILFPQKFEVFASLVASVAHEKTDVLILNFFM